MNNIFFKSNITDIYINRMVISEFSFKNLNQLIDNKIKEVQSFNIIYRTYTRRTAAQKIKFISNNL